MVDEGFGLDAYLARIGYEGPREPSLLALRGIVAAHSAGIAFDEGPTSRMSVTAT
jgi:N-hydroxyarylamine O-acetyltransferase